MHTKDVLSAASVEVGLPIMVGNNRTREGNAGMPDRIRLDGRVAVVTGAAGVIGAATMQLLAERGAHIVAVDRKLQELQTAIKELPASVERSNLFSTRLSNSLTRSCAPVCAAAAAPAFRRGRSGSFCPATAGRAISCAIATKPSRERSKIGCCSKRNRT